MKNSFSKRHLKIEKPIIDLNSVYRPLRTSLWNSYVNYMIENWKYQWEQNNQWKEKELFFDFHKRVWDEVLELSRMDWTLNSCVAVLESEFENRSWAELFDLIEEMLSFNPSYPAEIWEVDMNRRLENHNSAFMLRELKFVPRFDAVELEAINGFAEDVIGTTHERIIEHQREALKQLGPNGSVRLSIKESISIVEAVARPLADGETTLGKALKKLKKDSTGHTLLSEQHEKFYTFSNGKEGIRHSLMDDQTVTTDEAKYFLVTCSAFARYLLAVGRKNGVFKQ